MVSKSFMLIGILVITTINADEANIQKRQIYREEVLPHAGGRIPDGAFQTDRLFLNQLQKEGISVPDGVVPEQRNPQVYPFLSKPMREVFRVALSSDGRYIPNEGRYHYSEVPSVETTYLYPQIQGQLIQIPQRKPNYPIYKQIQLQNSLLNQVKFQPKKKVPFTQGMTLVRATEKMAKPSKASSYQNFNYLKHVPIAPDVSRIGYHYYPEYDSTHLYGDFDNIFNNLHFNSPSSTRSYKKPNKYPVQHIMI